MFAFGAGSFVLGFAPAALRPTLCGALRRPIVVTSLVALLSAAGWLVVEAAAMAVDWRFIFDVGAWRDVLLDTAFGCVWEARLALLLALTVTVLARGQGP